MSIAVCLLTVSAFHALLPTLPVVFLSFVVPQCYSIHKCLFGFAIFVFEVRACVLYMMSLVVVSGIVAE